MNTQSYDELCYENDEINRKWAEDNERNGDIMAEQQEQIIRLEEENKELKEDNELNKGMIEFLQEKIEILEKQLDRRD